MLDVGTARLSWRRLWSLIAHLPRESHYARIIGGEQAEWGHSEHLLATVVDVLQIGNWMYASAHSKRSVSKPKQLPRPGDQPSSDGRVGTARHTEAEMQQILDTWSERASGEFRTEEMG